jgi:hypothetical protein
LDENLQRTPEILGYVDLIDLALPSELDTLTADSLHNTAKSLVMARIRLLNNASSYRSWVQLTNLIAPEAAHDVPRRFISVEPTERDTLFADAHPRGFVRGAVAAFLGDDIEPNSANT